MLAGTSTEPKGHLQAICLVELCLREVHRRGGGQEQGYVHQCRVDEKEASWEEWESLEPRRGARLRVGWGFALGTPGLCSLLVSALGSTRWQQQALHFHG